MAKLTDDLDPTPLAEKLLAQTLAGKINWEATAGSDVFVSALAGNVLKLGTENIDEIDSDGNPYTVVRPTLEMIGAKNVVMWRIGNREVKGGLSKLQKAARRVAFKLDEKLSEMLETLDKL